MTTGASHAAHETEDFRTLLEQELHSCQLPGVNPQSATSDEIIRDLHRVIAGNGDFTKGMIYKVAAATAQIKVLRVQTEATNERVEEQVERCREIHAALNTELGTAEMMASKKIWGFLWEHKVSIFLALLFMGQVVLGVRMSTAAQRAQSVASRDEVTLSQVVGALQALGVSVDTNTVKTAAVPPH